MSIIRTRIHKIYDKIENKLPWETRQIERLKII